MKEKRRLRGMKYMLAGLLSVCLMLCICGCGSDAAGTATSGRISTDGSTSMEKTIGSLGEFYMLKYPDVNFTFNPTGSGSGIVAVADGRCDIGLSSRALKDEEKARGLTETVLAYDGIAVVVNPENAVTDLSLDEIAAIYTSKITNWLLKLPQQVFPCLRILTKQPLRLKLLSPQILQ